MRSVRAALALVVLVVAAGATADSAAFRPFRSGSYAELLASRPGRPFLLFAWSTTCEPCVQQLRLLQELSRQTPRVSMVLVTTDGAESQLAAGEILARYGLEHEDIWRFEGAQAQLQKEIDPRWDGRLPRTWLYDASHARQTIEGSLDRGRVLGWSRQVTAMH